MMWVLLAILGSWQNGNWPSARGWTKAMADGKGNIFLYGGRTPCGDPFANTIWKFNTSTGLFNILYTSGGGQYVNGACITPKTIEGDQNGVAGDRHPEEASSLDTKRGQFHQTGGITDLTKYQDNFSVDLLNGNLVFWPDNPSIMGPKREEGMMAYDASQDMDVYFGGEVNGGADNKTFIRTAGGTWSQLKTTITPPSRIRGRLVYSSALGKVVLLGGLSGSNWLNDTWALDIPNATWINLNPTGTPPPAGTHWLTFTDDPVTGVMFCYVNTNQLYALDPVNKVWTLTSNQGGPPAPNPTISNAMFMVMEPVTHTLYLFYPTVNDNNQQIYVFTNPSIN